MNGGDIPDNLSTFLEEYMEKIGEESKEIRRDLELIKELDEVFFIGSYYLQKYTSLMSDIENLKSELLESAETRVKASSIFACSLLAYRY